MVHGLSSTLRDALEELSRVAGEVAAGDLDPMERYANWALEAVTGGGKLIFCGNGGSAADAQHLAAEYVVRMEADRRALPAMALTTDTSVLTAQSNDHGYDYVFARQVEALAGPADLLVLHSTSGNSPNLLRAAEAARSKGVRTVALLAKGGGLLAERVDAAFIVPTETTSRAQEIHLTLGHAVCNFVESRVVAETARADLPGRIPEELQALRAREKTQTLFYRGLAARAEEEGDSALVDRFNDLHADEQHHLSRLTARLLELGESPAELPRNTPALPSWERWEEEARDRESTEVAAYESALAACSGDEETVRILEEILASEHQHLAHLGGKWMPA